MLRLIWIVFCLLLSALMPLAECPAEAVADEAAAEGRLLRKSIVVPVDDWVPYRFVSDGTMSGVDFDLWAELGERLSFEVEFQHTPWNRSLAQMRQGRGDAMSGLARTSEQEKYIYYVEPPYSSCSTVFYTKKGNGAQIKAYSDLMGKQVGFVLGSAYYPLFDSDGSLNKIGVATEEQLLKMMLAGRVDVMIGTDCQVDYELIKQGFSKELEKTAFNPGNRVDLYLGISRFSKMYRAIPTFENVMREMQADGTLQRINDKYFLKVEVDNNREVIE
ncbi:substrate-binding periplasmic protein [Oleidesulfovibrio sp.]|uniref:substrate-binding periplasmic protein n=1 Tax=Oleidesulfovibrio sp. TaxID=2909707 RepID=UPI003A8B4C19